MDRTTYLDHYRAIADLTGAAIAVRRSGSAVTYKAEDTRSGEEVALEVIPAEGVAPEVLAELEDEAAGAKELSHINVPKLHAFGREQGHVVYVSEYFDGTSAEEWIKAQGPMPVGPALRIGVQVVSTLGAAAFHGIVHGAINPRNILLVPGQTAQGDWPLVKILNLIGLPPTFTGSQFAAAEPEFTAQFASPEQLQNGAVDFRSEMYSLGATLWFLLTGTLPAAATDVPRVSGLPKPVTNLLEEMLAQNPEERPHDPLVFQERIRACLEGVERREAIGRKFGVPTPAPVPVVLKERSIPWRPLTIAALALFLATMTFVFWPRPGQTFASKKNEPLGVPIGVPEPAAPSSVQTVANPLVAPTAPPSPQVVAVEPSPVPAESAVEKQPTNQPITEPAPVVAKVEPSVAPIITQADPPPPATVETVPIAEEALRAEPVQTMPPAPAPVAQRAQPRVAEPVLRAEPVLAAQPAMETNRGARTSKRPKRINGLEVRAAEPPDGTPGLPKRTQRARFLGTADDGSLVFEMPSSEAGYVAPRR